MVHNLKLVITPPRNYNVLHLKSNQEVQQLVKGSGLLDLSLGWLRAGPECGQKRMLVRTVLAPYSGSLGQEMNKIVKCPIQSVPPSVFVSNS